MASSEAWNSKRRLQSALSAGHTVQAIRPSRLSGAAFRSELTIDTIFADFTPWGILAPSMLGRRDRAVIVGCFTGCNILSQRDLDVSFLLIIQGCDDEYGTCQPELFASFVSRLGEEYRMLLKAMRHARCDDASGAAIRKHRQQVGKAPHHRTWRVCNEDLNLNRLLGAPKEFRGEAGNVILYACSDYRQHGSRIPWISSAIIAAIARRRACTANSTEGVGGRFRV
ncbi:hypothetical protein K491DRAFT_297598 [Lophiostoma macrostomum CBS 122681]|uniref:Uncharacterized protein n=1 Tax=Lophiostoma macrostomum CBS 122681 TaxID=1314788 RepID=A0A6A6TFD0_9PLEO|nr:hypothetical protein K491DRAFT_297598 [Lophiostoma macrostomum CBS 122681]